MAKQNYHKLIFVSLCAIILILDSQHAFIGASEGIRLCIESVIPSLFPFFFISTIITTLLKTTIRRTTDINKILLLIGYISGYPIGAKTVHQAYKDGQISKDHAEKMLAICNNAGPAFIFGVLSHLFPRKILLWSIWGTQISSSLIILSFLSHNNAANKQNSYSQDSKSITQSLQNAIQSMASVCGWVILFKTFLSILNYRLLSYITPIARIILTGICELTNGCFSLSSIESQPEKYLLCNIFLSFGGLCITMQTSSVSTPLRIKKYLKLKVAQCAIAGTIAYLLLPVVYKESNLSSIAILRYPAGIITIIFASIIFKKTVAFLKKLLYNGKKSYTRGLHYDF